MYHIFDLALYSNSFYYSYKCYWLYCYGNGYKYVRSCICYNYVFYIWFDYFWDIDR